jgi:GNAT superfamily N-acetyltransferase
MNFLVGKVEMSFEEFQALPRILGWKYEYLQGCGYIEPRGCPVGAVLRLAEEIEAHPEVQAIESFDELEGLFVEAFANSVDYAGFSLDMMKERARKTLKVHRAGKRGEPRAESRVFLREGSPVGAALLVQKAHGPHLDILMVRPDQQRQGVAKALIENVGGSLLKSGERSLTSAYHLSNIPSRGWHRRMGFEEIPDLYAENVLQRHRMINGGHQGKKSRTSKHRLWLNELSKRFGQDSVYTLDTLLRPGRVGRMNCPDWLQSILDFPERLP